MPGNGYFSFNTFLGLTLPWIFFCISNSQVGQRLFTPKSMKDLRRLLLGFFVFGFIYTLVSIFWGFSALLQFPELATADLATPKLLASSLVPKELGIIVMVGIMAAAISTIDSILLTLSSLVARDVFGVSYNEASESRQFLLGKVVIPVIASLAYLFAQLELDLIAVLSVSASAGLLVMVPATVGSFFWKRGTKSEVLASVIVGGLIVFFLELTSTKWLGQGSAVWGFIASVTLYIGVSLLTKAPEAKAAQFLGYVKKALNREGSLLIHAVQWLQLL